jgi:hypothetical protein
MKKIYVAALLSCLVSPLSWAGIITGQDENIGQGDLLSSTDNAFTQFTSGFEVWGEESFESVAPGTNAYKNPIVMDFGHGISAELSGAGVVLDELRWGRFPLHGDHYYNVAGTFTITFAQAINAFGFLGLDINDVGGVLSVAIDDLEPVVVDSTFGTTNALFWGLTSDTPFQSITFFNSSGTIKANDGFGFDRFVVGITPVSEPQGIAALALLMLGGITYRSKHRKGS